MKNITTLFFIVLISVQVFAQDFAGGTGTSQDPYQISNVHQLQAMKDYLNSNFILINDIDATETATWNEVDGHYLGFEPIGTTGFLSTLDGKGHSIINLTINRSDEDNVGLFRIASSYNVRAIQLINVLIFGRDNVGGIYGTGEFIMKYDDNRQIVTGRINGRDNVGGYAGYIHAVSGNNIINNVSINGQIEGRNNVGGIIGNHSAVFDNLFSLLNFKGEIYGVSRVGGLIGLCNIATIRVSSAEVSIVADSIVGGLIGKGNIEIENTYFSGEIYGSSYVGGFSGISNRIKSSYSYVEATIVADSIVGGLFGASDFDHRSISNTYSSCKITANSRVGGLFGDFTGLPEINSNIYWNAEAAGVDSWSGNEGTASNDKIIPLTTTEMRQQASFEGWDFENTWAIKSGDSLSFPYLRNNTQVPAPGLYIPVISSRNHHLYSSSLSIYPQPMSEEHVMMDLSSFEATNYTVEIYDLKGIHILSKSVHGAQIAQIHIAELPTGMYTMRLKNQSGQVVANARVLR